MKHVCSYVASMLCMHACVCVCVSVRVWLCVCVCVEVTARSGPLCYVCECVWECVMYVKPVLCARVADMHVAVVSPWHDKKRREKTEMPFPFLINPIILGVAFTISRRGKSTRNQCDFKMVASARKSHSEEVKDVFCLFKSLVTLTKLCFARECGRERSSFYIKIYINTRGSSYDLLLLRFFFLYLPV